MGLIFEAVFLSVYRQSKGLFKALPFFQLRQISYQSGLAQLVETHNYLQ